MMILVIPVYNLFLSLPLFLYHSRFFSRSSSFLLFHAFSFPTLFPFLRHFYMSSLRVLGSSLRYSCMSSPWLPSSLLRYFCMSSLSHSILFFVVHTCLPFIILAFPSSFPSSLTVIPAKAGIQKTKPKSKLKNLIFLILHVFSWKNHRRV